MKGYSNIVCWSLYSIIVALYVFRKFVSVVKSLTNQCVYGQNTQMQTNIQGNKRGMLNLGFSEENL